MFLQEESEELRALQSHIAAAETRLGQRLQLQERSAAATAARQDSIALDRALHEQRADVRFWPANSYIQHPADWGMQPTVIWDVVNMQEDRRRDHEDAQRRRLAVRGREALQQQIQDNAHLRELAKVQSTSMTGLATH